MSTTGLKVVKKDGKWYVVNANGTNISGPYSDLASANTALATAEDKALKGIL